MAPQSPEPPFGRPAEPTPEPVQFIPELPEPGAGPDAGPRPSEATRRALEGIGPDWSLQGRRVRLRRLAESDLPARLRMTNDPQLQLETIGQTVGERTPYDIRSWFVSLARDEASRQLAIEDESGRYIGDIDLHSVDMAHGEAWLEPLIGDPDVRARGPDHVAAYLKDALATLIDYLFRELGLRRLLAEVLSTNPVGLQVLGELGFADTGQIDHLNGVYSHIMELTPDRFVRPAG